ncbi:hypothetical protein ADIMK_0696 [Marinobacterium lacunae]|uniref:Uncharacterized protein n=1 Tax=Marinobacterium lacunae TaxID=1232683 RepID=A0A081G2I9_9GAMM|nr:hypothetical protein [Marinobacterium lacunae]KEA64994.1 hypothetical protein ADIMK_0696 [Marinobacterium lacunae]MBR9882314.1 hypothetical protein [Oceanospirillales bacterium]
MALANQQEVEALADKLTECANSIHEHLMAKVKNGELTHPQAQIIFQDEMVLRQCANSLYIDAVNCVVEGVAESQSSLIGVVEVARDELKRIAHIAVFIDLVADLVVLVTAAYAAKPAPILAAIKEVKEDLEALEEQDGQ